jgi:hypothetical protein
MKILLFLLFGGPLSLLPGNKIYEKPIEGPSISSSTHDDAIFANELVGQWKKIAGGEDANKNRVLEESEKMKLEPGAQDNLHFFSDGKCKVFGMDMELKATYTVKTVNGKKTIFIYADDDADLPKEDRETSALKFEIVSLQGDKLVVIPPTFNFLLGVYSRSK